MIYYNKLCGCLKRRFIMDFWIKIYHDKLFNLQMLVKSKRTAENVNRISDGSIVLISLLMVFKEIAYHGLQKITRWVTWGRHIPNSIGPMISAKVLKKWSFFKWVSVHGNSWCSSWDLPFIFEVPCVRKRLSFASMMSCDFVVFGYVWRQRFTPLSRRVTKAAKMPV